MAEIDYERNARYFEPASYKGGITLCVIGLLLFFTGKPVAALVGLLLGGLGGLLLHRQVAGRPSDEYIDRQVSAILADSASERSTSWAWIPKRSGSSIPSSSEATPSVRGAGSG